MKDLATREERAPEASSERRVVALDGVRGVAILLVMTYHFFIGALHGRPDLVAFDRWVLRISGVGWFGVDLFFVLSGFLITGILYDSREKAGRYFGTFYVRRCLRIFPVYYVFLALVAVLVPIVQPADRPAIESLGHHAWWYVTYLTNFRALFQPFLTTDFIVTGHLWSLAVEEQFYLVWPALVLFVPRRSLIYVCIAMIATVPFLRLALDLGGVERAVVYEWTPTRIDSLALGAAIALVARDADGLARIGRYAGAAASVAGASLIVLFFTRDGLALEDIWVQTVGFSALAVLSGALITSVVLAPSSGRLAGFFRLGVLRSFGRYSYALYLVHGPIALLLARRVDLPGSVVAVGGSLMPGALVFTAVAGGISVAAAIVSWYAIEQQFLRLKSLFPYGRSEPAGRETQAAPART